MAVEEGISAGFVTVAPSADPTGTGQLFDNKSRAGKFTSPANIVKITEIGWYCSNATEAGTFEVGLYTHDAGADEPEELINSFEAAKGTTAGWKKVTGLNITNISGNTIYWLAASLTNTATATNIDQTIVVGERRSHLNAISSLPDPWGTSDQLLNDRLLAIYAVYEFSGTNTQINIGDDWKAIAGVKINIGDVWKTVEGMQVNIGDAWKTVF